MYNEGLQIHNEFRERQIKIFVCNCAKEYAITSLTTHTVRVQTLCVAGLYVSGWIATGPVGVILSTMNSGFSTGKAVVADLEAGAGNKDQSKGGREVIQRLLAEKGLCWIIDFYYIRWLTGFSGKYSEVVWTPAQPCDIRKGTWSYTLKPNSHNSDLSMDMMEKAVIKNSKYNVIGIA